MSGYMTVACRTNDGTKYVFNAYSRNAHNVYANDLGFLDGDDTGALKYLDWHRGLSTDLSDKPVRENEYGVLLVDFSRKIIALNRNDWRMDTQRFYAPASSEFDRDMGNAGRITLVCPENSEEPLKLTPDMVKNWESCVERGIKSRDLDSIHPLPFPKTYYIRKPTPVFVVDYSPWSILHFHEKDDRKKFWAELEASDFEVNRKGWISRFRK